MAKVGSHFWCMGGVLCIGSWKRGGTALSLRNGSGDEHGAAGPRLPGTGGGLARPRERWQGGR